MDKEWQGYQGTKECGSCLEDGVDGYILKRNQCEQSQLTWNNPRK